MKEAIEISRPFDPRELFCNILLNCNPSNPKAIFEQFAKDMREDFVLHRSGSLNLSRDEITTLAHNDLLKEINDTLEAHDKANESFGIDVPVIMDEIQRIHDESKFDQNAGIFFQECSPLLNDDQQHIFHTIKERIDNTKGGLYNFDAPGGSGKTFLANVILAYVRQSGRIAVATAMSGIAATLMKLGTTFHRRFGVPIPTLSDSSSKIKLDSQQANLLRDAIVLIIDESSMMNHKLLDLLDRFLRILMGVNEYMGGKLVILMHDFWQILPVIPQGRRADIVAAAIINSEAWENFTRYEFAKT
jgi:hypothetical protein